MIQNLRQIKSRIKSIENTRKITRAMETISAAKLSRIKNSLHAARSYSISLESVLKRILRDIPAVENPLIKKRETVKNIAVCIIASDTGLCGTYNNNIIKLTEAFISNYDRGNVRVIAVGKEVFAYFKNKGYSITRAHIGLYGRYSIKISQELVSELTAIFLSKETDEVYVAYTHFKTSLRHSPVVEKFLNIDRDEGKGTHYILEPDAETILNETIPRYLAARMNTVIMDAFTAEHSARMLAMKIATDNAEELIDALTLMRNKARQAQITKEVIEIAMAAEAVKE
ncbi:MAG: ATP synthase F1 subunit gamma [Candidatus Omnitrophota bacterium]|nr:ATP synthase F1 subunit gamma [Candidatus Omnitrophota bacterium]